VKQQSDLFKAQQRSLKPGEVIVLFDFTRFHETSSVKVHDLGIVKLTVNEDGDLDITYFDYIAEAPHKYHYTAHAMEDFMTNDADVKHAKRVIVWSDGGLRTKENLYLFSELQEELGVPIEVHIFAPGHGHSLCDGHFGVGKKAIRRRFAGALVATVEDVRQEFSKLTNTTVKVIPSVPQRDWRLLPLAEGIMHFYAFTFPEAGTVYCYTNYPLPGQPLPPAVIQEIRAAPPNWTKEEEERIRREIEGTNTEVPVTIEREQRGEECAEKVQNTIVERTESESTESESFESTESFESVERVSMRGKGGQELTLENYRKMLVPQLRQELKTWGVPLPAGYVRKDVLLGMIAKELQRRTNNEELRDEREES
jgi:hypothetical protein